MKHTRISTLLLMAVLAAMLAGCVEFELRVTNRTGSAIQFYSGHTKKTITIPAGATRVVPHVAGSIRIVLNPNEIVEYDALNVPDFKGEVVKGIQRLTLLLGVESNGDLTLPSGKKLTPTKRIYQ